MRKIFCFGEAVFDIIFKDEKPLECKPGGAMLNISVSLGRLGMPVYFIGDFAKDKVGEIIKKFLQQNKVDTSYITMYENAKSRIALAFLDQNNNADYSFYKIRVSEKLHIAFPEVNENDIILFGSFYAIKPEIREMVVSFLEHCKQKKAIILYDPNFRKAHLDMLPIVTSYIKKNIEYADITKGSDEDFLNIFKICSSEETYQQLPQLAEKPLIYTMNRNGVDFINNRGRFHVPAIGLKPLSTVGAGDTFSAGMAYWLYTNKVSHDSLATLTSADFEQMIRMAIEFASDVCLSFDNYVSLDFAAKVAQESGIATSIS